jgi:hypothetical protein
MYIFRNKLIFMTYEFIYEKFYKHIENSTYVCLANGLCWEEQNWMNHRDSGKFHACEPRVSGDSP